MSERENLHDMANRNAKECMAAFGREVILGPSGWKGGKDPMAFIYEAIMRAFEQAGLTPHDR